MALRKQTGRPVRLRERFGLMAIGHALKQVEEFLFDWLLYGAVVAHTTTMFGPYWGSLLAFAIMTPLSAVLSLIYVLFYDLTKKDWFGFEAAKSVRDEFEGRGFWKGIVRVALRFGDAPAFIALSLYCDPFMTTIYLRKGTEQYDGLSGRDWRIFFGSVVVSNGYWTLQSTVLVVSAVWVWDYLPESVQNMLLETWNWVTTLIL